MQVIIQVRNVYGREMYYPISESAKTFAKLTGKKTLDRADLASITSLGFEVIAQPVLMPDFISK